MDQQSQSLLIVLVVVVIILLVWMMMRQRPAHLTPSRGSSSLMRGGLSPIHQGAYDYY